MGIGRSFLVFLLLLATPTAETAAQSNDLVELSNGRLLAPAPIDEEIEVVDGDTIWVGVFQIRLFGIDAIEATQPCELKGRPKTYCHTSASEFLRTFTRRPDFRCEFHVKDGKNKPWVNHGRYVATCYVGEIDVNAEMVRNGWAFAANTSYGSAYKSFEEQARAKKLGVFATQVAPPWQWRKEQRGDDDCTCK